MPANKLSLLLGLIKAQGLLAPPVQRILQHHCSSGLVAEVADLVAEVLVDDGLSHGRLPTPRGLPTAELKAEVASAAKALVEEYAKRGVLCAKGYFPPGQLLMLVLARWEKEFASVLVAPEEETGIPMDHLHPDFIARSAVSAQALSVLLLRLPRNPEGDLILPMRELEGLCVKATRTMFRAFNNPDEVIHEMLHGGSSDE